MGLDVASGLPIAGLIACSGYPHPGWVPVAPLTRVLLTHGEQDPVVPLAASVEVLRLLRQAGARADLLPFAGGHTIDASLFPSLRAFLLDQWKDIPGAP
jgi:phospholipase/carboxylesterase